MKLLICTQAVDKDDPVLGFFHRWLEEFSKHFESIQVICLREGKHDLPENVFVHSLGKESGRSRLKYLKRFYRYIREFRREYDAVFVHMNQEYVLLGAPLWRVWGKRVTMWRNHYAGSILTNLAAAWCDKIFCTSSRSYTARFKQTVLMPIGIDTEFFSPGEKAPKQNSILFLGRLDPPKRADTFVRALEMLHDEAIPFSADIVGTPSDARSKYAHDVRNLAAPLALEGTLAMRPAVTNEEARNLFRTHTAYCNLSPQGMFDKTIGEAMACGAIVVARNDALNGVLPGSLMPEDESDAAAARSLLAALKMPENERREFAAQGRAWIEREHSLALLTERLFSILST